MNVLKSLAGAICGCLVFAVTAVALGQVSGRNLHAAQPLWFVGLTTAYGMLFASLGALLATRIAPHRGWSVIGMTALLVAGAAGSLIASPTTDAQGSQWAALIVMAPSACLAPARTRAGSVTVGD